MQYRDIIYQVDDPVAVIKFNRPEALNAFTGRMLAEIRHALAAAETDEHVVGIVLTGEGRGFCPGMDMNALDAISDGETGSNDDLADLKAQPGDPELGDNFQVTYSYLMSIRKPVIAAINGAAVGVGMTYPMLCDIRLASEGAKMGFVFTRRGMMPELAAHLIVQRVAGLSNAADILLSGRIFTSEEALEMGIVSKVFPKDQLLDAAHEMAKDYANTAPASVAITKHLLWQGLDSSPKKMMEAEGPSFAWLGNQPDAKEGIMSFLEKRAPAWELSAQDVPDEFKNG